ncbi:hypothetical protein DLEV_015 [Diachasmimorpha longicaudata entomopoxvirus]|uniref:Bro-N domain-containing protein n=1 Tax=Diachasmimorpha longicaudata entomopoxvirus TaxID=109981 RepID=A0A7R5WNJ9_9POXV|nr:hypothetical protein QKK69_gp015 [Diachasmimorpha longicaudata entomopoxvirus]AKS26306.1 hypothetical protein DLEV_015 [Diachasmimorpha longicaudata entomopoxvirus]
MLPFDSDFRATFHYFHYPLYVTGTGSRPYFKFFHIAKILKMSHIKSKQIVEILPSPLKKYLFEIEPENNTGDKISIFISDIGLLKILATTTHYTFQSFLDKEVFPLLRRRRLMDIENGWSYLRFTDNLSDQTIASRRQMLPVDPFDYVYVVIYKKDDQICFLRTLYKYLIQKVPNNSELLVLPIRVYNHTELIKNIKNKESDLKYQFIKNKIIPQNDFIIERFLIWFRQMTLSYVIP